MTPLSGKKTDASTIYDARLFRLRALNAAPVAGADAASWIFTIEAIGNHSTPVLNLVILRPQETVCPCHKAWPSARGSDVRAAGPEKGDCSHRSLGACAKRKNSASLRIGQEVF